MIGTHMEDAAVMEANEFIALKEKIGEAAVTMLMNGNAVVIGLHMYDGYATRIEYVKNHGGGFFCPLDDARVDITTRESGGKVND